MTLTTTDSVPGRRVKRILGIVQGSTVRSRDVGKDLLAAFKNITGGEITQYTKLMAESREQVLDRMREQAAELGADTVVGVRFITSSVMQNASELVVYGTAVETEPE